MKAIVALIVVAAYIWLSRAKRYLCSEIGCTSPCFMDGDLCGPCRKWLADCEPLGPPEHTQFLELHGLYGYSVKGVEE